MRNPIRKNKNIGKTQGGRVKDGRPNEKWSRLFPENEWEKISRENKQWTFFTENPSRNYFHPCNPEEYIEVLERLPKRHSEDVKGIILRRTTKYDLKMGIEAWRRYSCVIMNSFPKNMKYVFQNKPSDSMFKHFEKYTSNWLQVGDERHLLWELEGVRRYYLYHVFLHEIGHIFDRYRKTSTYKKENYAESFARDMADWLGE